MGRDEIPYLHVMKAKGRIYRYYRRDGVRWAKLDGTPGTVEFAASYQRAEARYSGRHDAAHLDGSFGAMVAAYKQSADFRLLGARTKEEYLRHLDQMLLRFRDLPAASMKSAHGLNYLDEFIERPSVGNSRIKVLKKVYSFGTMRGLVPANPILGIKPLPEGEYLPWPDDIIAQFRASEPTAEMIWAMECAQYTGQRRGDLLTMAWPHYDGEGIDVVQAKTGARLWIPAHPDLKLVLAGIERRGPLILTTAKGHAWDPDYFTHEFRKATRKAGIEGYVFHGLRKTAASRLAEVGCSEAEIMSITGHRTAAMVQKYTKGANQKRLAKAAIARLPVMNRGKK